MLPDPALLAIDQVFAAKAEPTRSFVKSKTGSHNPPIHREQCRDGKGEFTNPCAPGISIDSPFSVAVSSAGNVFFRTTFAGSGVGGRIGSTSRQRQHCGSERFLVRPHEYRSHLPRFQMAIGARSELSPRAR
jgi:hypothetical protein